VTGALLFYAMTHYFRNYCILKVLIVKVLKDILEIFLRDPLL
jgi:hypothetical protein